MNFRSYLQNELVKRCKRNPSYSLRSFAKTLGISHAALSEILNGKRKITDKTARRLADHLGLSAGDLNSLQGTVDFSLSHIQQFALPPEQQIELADWYYYAIWELCSLKSHKADKGWIAKTLGIHPQEAFDAIEKMKTLGLISIKNGKLVKLKENLLDYSNSKHTSGTRKKIQKQFFEKALDAIDEIPYEHRHHSGMTMAIDSKKIEEAKELIKDFRRKLMNFLDSGTKNDSIYHLSVGLFPLEKHIYEKQKKKENL